MPNKEALKLPDPLLVRLYREGVIDEVKAVELDAKRNVTVSFHGDRPAQNYTHLVDVGWVPAE